MAEQQRKSRKSQSKKTEEAVDAPSEQDAKSGEDLKASLDELLDEIDEVLEENAEAFVKGYVQKGGQASRVRSFISWLVTPRVRHEKMPSLRDTQVNVRLRF